VFFPAVRLLSWEGAGRLLVGWAGVGRLGYVVAYLGHPLGPPVVYGIDTSELNAWCGLR